MLSHRIRGEAREIRLVCLGPHAPGLRCCPIKTQEGRQVEAVPDDATDEGEEPGEAVMPVAEECLEAQQQVEEQGGPDLPGHGVGAVAEEVAELEGLLDLLEEDLDLPAAALEVGDGGRGPDEVVGKKLHFHVLAIEFDQGRDPTQTVGILAPGMRGHEYDLAVPEAAPLRAAQPLLHHAEPHVIPSSWRSRASLDAATAVTAKTTLKMTWIQPSSFVFIGDRSRIAARC